MRPIDVLVLCGIEASDIANRNEHAPIRDEQTEFYDAASEFKVTPFSGTTPAPSALRPLPDQLCHQAGTHSHTSRPLMKCATATCPSGHTGALA
jgi:hypothetical protein